MAVAGLTITYEREQVLDFSTPFMTLGGSLLFMRPKSQKPSIFSFLQPLSPTVSRFHLLQLLSYTNFPHDFASSNDRQKTTTSHFLWTKLKCNEKIINSSISYVHCSATKPKKNRNLWPPLGRMSSPWCDASRPHYFCAYACRCGRTSSPPTSSSQLGCSWWRV